MEEFKLTKKEFVDRAVELRKHSPFKTFDEFIEHSENIENLMLKLEDFTPDEIDEIVIMFENAVNQS